MKSRVSGASPGAEGRPAGKPRGEQLLQLAVFSATVAWAIVFQWTPGGIVWGLWFTSLVAGGFLVMLPFVLGTLFESPEDLSRPGDTVARVIITLIIAGTYGFFHLGYLHLLGEFVEPTGPAMQAFFQAESWWAFPPVLEESMVDYWPMVAGTISVGLFHFYHDLKNDPDELIVGPWMTLPRLHALVFAFVLLQGLGLRSAMSAVALFVLYFPVDRALYRRYRRLRSRGGRWR